MTENPSLVIVSSSNTRPKSLMKLLTKSKNIQEDASNPKIVHRWTIETKYYTAEVDVIGINDHSERTPEFNQNVEALIVHMDSNKESGLKDLSKWSPLHEECEPEIKLLIANYCTNETKITKSQATEWCLERGFELIELYPTKDASNNSEDSDQDIIKEKVGVERVIEALQAHTWSNLVMKDDRVNNVENLCDEFLTTEGIDDFSDLFSQLSTMKSSIQSLNPSQRKQCAEQMVTAFWKAIGGDEEEILDL